MLFSGENPLVRGSLTVNPQSFGGMQMPAANMAPIGGSSTDTLAVNGLQVWSSDPGM